MSDIVIIGAGITGLSCARFLRKPYILLEKNDHPGGLCGSVKIDGFTFDYSGHFLHLHSPFAKDLIKELLASNIKEVQRRAFIYTSETFVPYPFQANLSPLPASIKKECVEGFLHRPKYAKADNFYRWSMTTFGDGITRYFMKPYNEKLWTVPATRLATDWVAPFVPQPTEKDVIESARQKQKKTFGYNAVFYYPARGGSQAVINAMARDIQHLRCGTAAVRVDWKKKTVLTADGERLRYASLVSTQPLPLLLKSMTGLPATVKEAAERLDWNEVTCLNIAIKKQRSLAGRHWFYFPEKKYPFYRVGVYSNVAPSMTTPGFDSLYVEISNRPGRKISTARLLTPVIAALRNCGIIASFDDVAFVNRLDIPFAYVIFDQHRQPALAVIQEFLKRNRIHSIGRYGAWEYSFMERSILDARELAEQLNHEQR
jgi:protoporphyrinogen oxidase